MGRQAILSAEERATTPALRLHGRDDLDLQRRIRIYLAMRSVPGGESIRALAAGGNVVLDGIVPSFSAKLRCLECCRHVAGVLNVIDRLVVGGDETIKAEG